MILGRPDLWSRQKEICRSVVEYPVTLVQAGNSVGKSFVDASLILWFLISHRNCLVLATAPSQVQLNEVLWLQVEQAYKGSRIPLGGRALRSPLKIDLGNSWEAIAYSTTRTERLSGHHRGDLLIVVDEASGIEKPIYEALDSCNPSRYLLTGNPLRPTGIFYERCQRAREGNNPDSNLIHIPSTDSPDIHLERSPRGLADQSWLRKMRSDWGEGSLWWKTHVAAEFPDSADDTLIPISWLNRAGAVSHIPAGPVRLAIDLAEGGGGDRSVLLARDDNGILALEYSSSWTLEETARRAAVLVRKFGISHHRVVFDAAAIGSDFANRLQTEGIIGPRPFKGGFSGGKSFANLRSAAAWALRQRLDPNRKIHPPPQPSRQSPFPQVVRMGEIQIPEPDPDLTQPPFSIRPDWLALIRPELQALKYSNRNEKQVALEPGEILARTLGHSPDLAACLIMSFGFLD